MWELDCKKIGVLKNWCSWTVVLEKTLKSPLDYKEIQPVNPKENQSWILEGLMLKLKLQYFGHLMWRTDSFEKTLMLGKIEGGRRRGWQSMRWLDGTPNSMDVSLVSSMSWWWTGKPWELQSMGVAKSQTLLSDWTDCTEKEWNNAICSYMNRPRDYHSKWSKPDFTYMWNL